MTRKTLINILLVIIFQVFSLIAMASTKEPSDPGSGPTTGEPPLGGGAPLSGGVIIMLVLGAAYGCKKVYDLRKERKQV